LVQHGAVAPQADPERFSKIVERFFNTILEKIFGFKPNELKIFSVIDFPIVKMKLEKSEQDLDKGEWLNSIVATRDAFENAYFRQIKNHNISLSFYPALVHAREKNNISSYIWDAVKDELELSYLGINTFEYHRFKEYLNHIPHELGAEDSWGNAVLPRAWNQQDALFCYNYAANTILRWQTQEMEKWNLILNLKLAYKESIHS